MNNNTNNNNNNGMLMLILLVVATILILFFPKVYGLITKLRMPKIEYVEEKEQKEEKVINEEMLEAIHFPLMRTSIYDPNTYYSLDTFRISNMSNSDILTNAFLDIYEGNITAHNGYVNCTNNAKEFKQKYMKLRIENILGKDVKYSLGNFYVPEDSKSNYKGNWNYDAANSRFIYVGLCNSKATNIKYYNLEELIKMEFENDDIVVYYYVGFAKVEGNNYIIYKNPKMTEELTKGTFTSIDNLNNEFKNINKKKKQIYKSTFKDTLCSYGDY